MTLTPSAASLSEHHDVMVIGGGPGGGGTAAELAETGKRILLRGRQTEGVRGGTVPVIQAIGGHSHPKTGPGALFLVDCLNVTLGSR